MMNVKEPKGIYEEECNMAEHPSKLSFSIEESVWLNKGQEVREVVSMSLEPEISIEERDQHVYIKGGLRLIGEYHSEQEVVEELNVNESLEDQLSFRSVEEVSLADGIGEIKHYFPIDVTIPLSRIQNLDEVYVQVESFDYDLPEKSCIQLTADISISGMNQYGEDTQSREPAEPMEEVEEVPALEAIPSAFTFEAKRRPELETVPLNEMTEPRMEEVTTEPEPEREPIKEEEKLEVEQPEEHVTSPCAQQKSTNESYDRPGPWGEPAFENSLEEEFLNEEELEEEDRPAEQELQTEPETKINLAPLKELAKPPVETTKEEVKNRAPKEETTEPSFKEENALYLTKMLARGEERFSKWKMCIIQENESLDLIAERYEISTSQLVRINRLEREHIEEGQILYIPVTSQT